jgi:hypothetical protein
LLALLFISTKISFTFVFFSKFFKPTSVVFPALSFFRAIFQKAEFFLKDLHEHLLAILTAFTFLTNFKAKLISLIFVFIFDKSENQTNFWFKTHQQVLLCLLIAFLFVI